MALLIFYAVRIVTQFSTSLISLIRGTFRLTQIQALPPLPLAAATVERNNVTRHLICWYLIIVSALLWELRSQESSMAAMRMSLSLRFSSSLARFFLRASAQSRHNSFEADFDFLEMRYGRTRLIHAVRAEELIRFCRWDALKVKFRDPATKYVLSQALIANSFSEAELVAGLIRKLRQREIGRASKAVVQVFCYLGFWRAADLIRNQGKPALSTRELSELQARFFYSDLIGKLARRPHRLGVLERTVSSNLNRSISALIDAIQNKKVLLIGGSNRPESIQNQSLGECDTTVRTVSLGQESNLPIFKDAQILSANTEFFSKAAPSERDLELLKEKIWLIPATAQNLPLAQQFDHAIFIEEGLWKIGQVTPLAVTRLLLILLGFRPTSLKVFGTDLYTRGPSRNTRSLSFHRHAPELGSIHDPVVDFEVLSYLREKKKIEILENEQLFESGRQSFLEALEQRGGLSQF